MKFIIILCIAFDMLITLYGHYSIYMYIIIILLYNIILMYVV